MKGIITDIQRFSLHDGSGIRSTVFFKGCNMRCAWCHNPETLRPGIEQAHYPDKCIHCGHCEDYCPTGARTVIGREVTADDILKEVLPDADYYAASGGGVTLSGGEPFLQADFLAELIPALKAHGLSVDAETNLSLPWERLESGLRQLEHLYFDIKLMEPGAHIRYTGIPNDQILDNAKRLKALAVPFTVRTPLIPGITDTPANIRAAAAFAAGIGAAGYELLNYNALAKAKYAPVGQAWSLPDLKPLKGPALEDLRRLAEDQGIRCAVRRG